MKDQVLVVEDEQAIAAFVQMSLERAGFSVSVARNGEDALVQVQSDSPQLKVFGREMLLERVWGYDYAGESRTVDVHIQRLRSKVEPDPDQPRYLLTVYGVGYRFASEGDL